MASFGCPFSLACLRRYLKPGESRKTAATSIPSNRSPHLNRPHQISRLTNVKQTSFNCKVGTSVKMRKMLTMAWRRLCNLVKISQPVRVPLRDKAIAVAARVSVVKVRDTMQACCPVCSEAISAPPNSDVKMILAVHLSLWHPEDVKLQWDIMQNKSFVHVPSLILGVGIAAGVGVLLASLSKNRAQTLVRQTVNQPRFKSS
ncbi:hypothetical protein ACH5RR_007778 [Cinchona calisaya]|uniref:Uncharacterized protein n=1 Tax=Cinchona calisaya TaxID=153742 RepID=A0ABD3A9N2_9GENT